jgi:hypothetical protein
MTRHLLSTEHGVARVHNPRPPWGQVMVTWKFMLQDSTESVYVPESLKSSADFQRLSLKVLKVLRNVPQVTLQTT